MPTYQKAKPFDFVQVVKNLQTAVKQLQIRSPGVSTPWEQATLLAGWTGTLNYRKTQDNEVQLSAYELTPGTLTDGTVIAAVEFLPPNNHQFTCTPSAARITLDPTGNIAIAGAAGITTLSFEERIPLDI
jgi:hypothetical protein